MIQLFHQIIHYDLERIYHKMSINEKSKTIDKKIKQNKAQYGLDKQSPKQSSTLSLINVSGYEFLTGKDFVPEKDLLEKAATMKRFEYSSLGKKLKAQNDIAKKQSKS